MMVSEQVTEKLRNLPLAKQEEVLDFVDFLLHKSEKRELDQNGRTNQEKREALERWVKKHSTSTAVLLDDSREIIYED